MKNRNFYAKYDWSAKPSNPGFGFANAKRVAVFLSKSERDAFVDYREDFDYSCEPISQKDALTYRESGPDGEKGGWFFCEDGTQTDRFCAFGRQSIYA